MAACFSLGITCAAFCRLTIHVLNRNDPPVCLETPLYISENVPVGTVANHKWLLPGVNSTYGVPHGLYDRRVTAAAAVQCSDEDGTYPVVYLSAENSGPTSAAFDINATAFVSLVNGSIDYEVLSRYEIQVAANDTTFWLLPHFPPQLFNIELRVRDENDPTTVKLVGNTASINANPAVGTVLSGLPVSVYDQDTWQNLTLILEESSLSDSNHFFVFGNYSSVMHNGVRDLQSLVVQLPNLPTGVRSARVGALDVEQGTTAYAKTQGVITVADVDRPPVCPTLTASVPENSPAGTVVNVTLTCSDFNLYQNLLFSVTGDLMNYFEVAPQPQPVLGITTTNFLPLTLEIENNLPKYFQRNATLLVKMNALDYENTGPINHVYAVTINVADDNVLMRTATNPDGSVFTQLFKAPGVGQSSTLQVNVMVLNVPDVPVVQAVVQSETLGLVSSGGENIVLHGINFGSSQPPYILKGVSGVSHILAQYGNAVSVFNASSCTILVDFTSMSCTSSPGFGQGHQWRVSVGGQWSQPSADVSYYAKPSVSGFSIGAQSISVLSTVGGTSINISGSQFGPAAMSAVSLGKVTYGIQGDEYNASACVIVADYTTIQCVCSSEHARTF